MPICWTLYHFVDQYCIHNMVDIATFSYRYSKSHRIDQYYILIDYSPTFIYCLLSSCPSSARCSALFKRPTVLSRSNMIYRARRSTVVDTITHGLNGAPVAQRRILQYVQVNGIDITTYLAQHCDAFHTEAPSSMRYRRPALFSCKMTPTSPSGISRTISGRHCNE